MSRNAPFVDDPQKAGFVFALLCEFLGDYGEEKADFSDDELAAVRRIAACCRSATGAGSAGDAPVSSTRRRTSRAPPSHSPPPASLRCTTRASTTRN